METHREWEEETRESRQELAEGKGITFRSHRFASWALEEDDKETTNRGERKVNLKQKIRWVLVQRLIAYLRHHEPRQAKLKRIRGKLQNFLSMVEEIIIQEKSKDYPNSNFLLQLQKELDALKKAMMALDNQNVDLAIEVLKQAFPESEEGMSWA